MAVTIRFRRFYECDTEAERSLDFGSDSLIYCLDTSKYYKILGGGYVEVPADDVIFTSPINISKLNISGIPDGTKYLRDDGTWETPPVGTPGTGSPGGSNTQIQFNDSGVFNGDSGLFYDKTNNILGLESADFAQTPTAGSAERRLQWDEDEGSLTVTLRGGNLTIPLGQEVATLVYNAEATTLAKGEVVYAYGASGQRVSVKRARNTSDQYSAQTLGVVAESIASGAEGWVMVQGMVRGIDTSTYTQGDPLYLSATFGQFTATKQYAPNHLVYIGFVVKVHASAGEIFVKCQNGYEMDELHNVSAASPSDGDILKYVTSTGLWTKTAGTTTNISEGTNLYYTDARVKSAISANVVTDYDNTITGLRNSSNKIFTTSSNFVSGSTKVYVNGLRYTPGGSYDYQETGANQITFTNAPDSGDLLIIDYVKS